MEITLFTEPEKEFQLTTMSPQSHYGIPVLRIEGDEAPYDYGPADNISLLDGLLVISGAELVDAWARGEDRTEEEREAARMFLSQWPDGPQLG
jgi:hypothetical protein